MPKLCPTPAHDAAVTLSLKIKTSAYFHDLGGRTENPGVGGSIPSLPTIFPNQCPVTEFFPI